MKGCLGYFAACFVGLLVLLFFFGSIPWAALAVVALVMAAAISAFVEQSDRIDALQRRVEELEAGERPPQAPPEENREEPQKEGPEDASGT